MSLTETIHERKRALGERPLSKFVPREEFCRLLLSCKRMVRVDEPAHQIRGLLDVDTGMRFFIEQEELFSKG
jgi:hypothetical protein